MKSYFQGFITGSVFISSFFIFTGSNSSQLNAIEKEIIKIWEQEKQHDILIKNNRAKIKDINIVKKHVKTTKEKKGGIISKENFIHMSNLKELIDNKKVQAKK